MAFINETASMGIILTYLTDNITGSLFITLLLIVIAIISIALMFRIQLEWTAIIVFPLLLTLGSFDSAFFPVMGIGILYLAILTAKNFFFK